MPSTFEPQHFLAKPGSVQLNGVLGDALAANHLGRLSHFITDENSPAIAIFAPENVEGNLGGDWYGEHAGKWLIAASKAAVRTGDVKLLIRVRRVADYLISRQDADGYLGNYAPARRFMRGQPPKPVTWDGAPAERTWDMWTHSYLILGMIEVSRATGDAAYVACARRMADLVARTIMDDGHSITQFGNHFGLSATVMLDAVIELHFVTGDARYCDLAQHIAVQMDAEPRNRLIGMALQSADPSEIATGKAYQILWNLVGLAKLYRATGEGDYLAAVRNIWSAVRDHHLTLGGGPWGGVAHRSREVFNPAGYFSPEGYVETCSTMAWIQLNRELLLILGLPEFAQEIERSAYNDLIGAQAPNGEDWSYYSFPNGRRINTTYWRCCKSSGAMALEELPDIACTTTQSGAIAINILGPMQAQLEIPAAGAVRITQVTEYPHAGDFMIEISPERPARFAVLVRIPDWAGGAVRLTVAGKSVLATAGEYARIEREWQAGDTVSLQLDMLPTLHRARQSNVQESLAPDGSPVAQEVMRYDYVAVTCGPLVYATGLIDGYKLTETLSLSDESDSLRNDGGDVLLRSEKRDPIRFIPYYQVGRNQDGSWRLSWLPLAPQSEELADA